LFPQLMVSGRLSKQIFEAVHCRGQQPSHIINVDYIWPDDSRAETYIQY
jgi:hypothetical protein